MRAVWTRARLDAAELHAVVALTAEAGATRTATRVVLDASVPLRPRLP